MKLLKSLALVGALIASVVIGEKISSAFNSGVVINSTYAVSQVIPIPLGVGGVSNLSTSVTYSSPTFSTFTFTTGQVSTGSIVIQSNAALSTAAATESFVIKSTSGKLGDFVSLSYPIPPGAAIVRVNRDWVYGPSVSSAAINLAAALNRYSVRLGGVVFSTSPGGVVYATAPVGALYNNIVVVTNDTTTITVSTPTFLGGQDSAVVSVNGINFKANLNFNVGTSSNASAANLATAINAATVLSTSTGAGAYVKATSVAGDNHITIKSTAAGAAYSLVSSNKAAVAVFSSVTTPLASVYMYGAQTPSWALNGTSIKVPNHGYVTGLAVLYSTSGSPGISGLVDQTTYYAGVLDANDIALATTVARAAAGLFVPLASSSTLTTASTYKLAPLAFSLASQTGFNWEVSNDGSNWTQLNVSSLTYSTPGSQVWSFGALPFSFLGLNFTAPASGAIKLNVRAVGN